MTSLSGLRVSEYSHEVSLAQSFDHVRSPIEEETNRFLKCSQSYLVTLFKEMRRCIYISSRTIHIILASGAVFDLVGLHFWNIVLAILVLSTSEAAIEMLSRY